VTDPSVELDTLWRVAYVDALSRHGADRWYGYMDSMQGGYLPDSCVGPFDTRQDAIESVEESMRAVDEDSMSQVAVDALISYLLDGYDTVPYLYNSQSRLIEIVELDAFDAYKWAESEE